MVAAGQVNENRWYNQVKIKCPSYVKAVLEAGRKSGVLG